MNNKLSPPQLLPLVVKNRIVELHKSIQNT